MSSVRTIIDLRARLEEAIAIARQDAEESHNAVMNPFVSSYVCGYLDALKKVLNTINDKDGDTL